MPTATGSNGAVFGDGIPDGVPIGRALLLPERLLYPDLYDAVRSISQVHGDGPLPVIPVLPLAGMDHRGRFVVRLGVPSAILINAQARHRGFALLHEVGHFLDFASVSTPGDYASSSANVELAQWQQATKHSTAVRSLALLIDELMTERPVEDQPHRRRLLEPLDLEEIWARSYAQYVTIRSGDPRLVAALDAIRTPVPGFVYYPTQWSDADFRPIGDALEQLFRRIGWRSQRR